MKEVSKCDVADFYPLIANARASDFVGKRQGKLRDYYRIGKILGTGKLTLTEVRS